MSDWSIAPWDRQGDGDGDGNGNGNGNGGGSGGLHLEHVAVAAATAADAAAMVDDTCGTVGSGSKGATRSGGMKADSRDKLIRGGTCFSSGRLDVLRVHRRCWCSGRRRRCRHAHADGGKVVVAPRAFGRALFFALLLCAATTASSAALPAPCLAFGRMTMAGTAASAATPYSVSLHATASPPFSHGGSGGIRKRKGDTFSPFSLVSTPAGMAPSLDLLPSPSSSSLSSSSALFAERRIASAAGAKAAVRRVNERRRKVTAATTTKKKHLTKKTKTTTPLRSPLLEQFGPRNSSHLLLGGLSSSLASSSTLTLPTATAAVSAMSMSMSMTTTTTTTRPEENREAASRKRDVDRRVADLLGDDDGEEDETAPDASDEAANEPAERASVGRVSETARMKANEAMSKHDGRAFELGRAESQDHDLDDIDDDNDNEEGKHGDASKAADFETAAAVTTASTMMTTTTTTTKKTKTRKNGVAATRMLNGGARHHLRATVRETGSDTIRSYTKSLANHELLSREAEVLLGKQIQILVRWEEQRQILEERLLRAPTYAQWAGAVGVSVPDLKKQIRKSHRAKAALVEANLRLVVTVARQTVKKHRTEIDFHDACQEGIVGLTRACEKYDPTKDFRFSTYAMWWIKGQIHRSVTDQSSPIKLPPSVRKKINEIRINERVLIAELGRKPSDCEVAERCGMSSEQLVFYRKRASEVQQVQSIDQRVTSSSGKGSQASGDSTRKPTEIGDLVSDDGPSPAEAASAQMLRDDVRRLVKTLGPREQAVVRLRFGLDDGEPKTLAQIGEKFGVDADKIRRVEARALLKLRQPYRNQSVKCYVSDL